MTLEQLKSELAKINQGCEKRFEISENRLAICGRYYYDEKEQTLCPSCQSKKQGIILGAKMMIEDEIKDLEDIKDKFCINLNENGQRVFVNYEKELCCGICNWINGNKLADLNKLNNWLEKE